MVKRVALLIAASVSMSSCAVLGFGGDCGGTEVIGKFNQVGDLVEQANVQSTDVKIGSIQEIKLDGWEASVTMCLDAKENISADVRAVVRTTSLLGEKFIDLSEQSPGPPFLEDGAVIEVADTGKATELEDVFARLGSILGTGNLEQLNRFTSAQANILRDNIDDTKTVLRKLREFTDILADQRGQVGASLDSLDSVAETILDDSSVLKRFLQSFASSSQVLARQKNDLRDLLFALDDFTDVSVALLDATEDGLNEQFAKLRPVLRTIVANSENLAKGLRTLASFSEFFPESVPGDYIQLDVCQAVPDNYAQGVTCPQAFQNTAPGPRARNALELILKQPLREGR
jgi:phospholipid/cholesterol/gamma-HCH transport system substrate-binding protein